MRVTRITFRFAENNQTMEKKHTEEYAKKLGDIYENTFIPPNGTESEDFVAGYMAAIRETAAPELLEALEIMTSLCRIKYGNLDKDIYEEILKAESAINKATK